MPSKTVKKTTPLVETPVTEPVQSTPVVVTQEASLPVSQPVKQKGGKKPSKTESAPVPVEVAPVSTPAPVEVAPVKTPVKRGGAKTPKVEATPTPVVEAKPAPKRVAKAKPVVEGTEQVAGKPKVARKQALKPKVPKAPKVAKPVVETEADNEESSDRHIRSFKVKLPEREDFEGRFTGLTPYQAANKALSKYFRETENPKKEITFLICESTRKSKKSVYTYVGKRYQLEVPVKYTIQDGREIVKNFKNSLKKVKKSETSESA